MPISSSTASNSPFAPSKPCSYTTSAGITYTYALASDYCAGYNLHEFYGEEMKYMPPPADLEHLKQLGALVADHKNPIPTEKPNKIINMQADRMKQYLLEAFDEGAECPYDLKDSAVSQIVEKIQKSETSQPKNESLDVKKIDFKKIDNHLAERIPAPIMQLLKNHDKMWLCGGSIIRLLLGITRYSLDGWLDSDWDVFCHESLVDSIPLTRKKNMSKDYVTKKQPKLDDPFIWNPEQWTDDPKPQTNTVTQVLRGKIKGIKETVNVISGNYNCFADAIKDFDLRMVQVGYGRSLNLPIPHFMYYNESLDDLINRRITLANETCTKSAGKVIRRIKKYISRGFHDKTGLVESDLCKFQ